MSKYHYPIHPILIVDDEEESYQTTSVTLKTGGMNNFVQCTESAKAMDLFAKTQFDLVMLDLSMPNLSGEELLASIKSDYPEIPVIIVTGANDVETAVRCINAGAIDYMVKPVEKNRMVTGVRRALQLRELRRENELLKESLFSNELKHPEAFSHIITNNQKMISIFKYIETVARTDKPILITGNSGVGKELFAKAIHQLSGKSDNFVAVNVAGLEDSIFSDTLFGHVKGAFTGAESVRKGMVETAAGGTLFLDEIGDLTIQSQVKLLRLLQEGEYHRLGSDVPSISDARIIVATNKDLDLLKEKGEFRNDLYFRLNVHRVHVPQLNERKDDIVLLLDHFLEKAATDLDKKKPAIPAELTQLLYTYHFPGNVRELEAMVFNAVSTHSSGILSLKTFRDATQKTMTQTENTNKPPAKQKNIFSSLTVLPTIEQVNEQLIETALDRAKGNQTIAAQLIGMTRSALNKRLLRASQKQP